MRLGVAVSAAVGIAVAGALAACSGPPPRPLPRSAPTCSAAAPRPCRAGSAGNHAGVVEGTPSTSSTATLNNSLGEQLPVGILAGVKGTIPGAEVPAEFQAAAARGRSEPHARLLLRRRGVRRSGPGRAERRGCRDPTPARTWRGSSPRSRTAPSSASTTRRAWRCVQKGASIDYQGRVRGDAPSRRRGDPTGAQSASTSSARTTASSPTPTYKRGQVKPEDQATPIDARRPGRRRRRRVHRGHRACRRAVPWPARAGRAGRRRSWPSPTSRRPAGIPGFDTCARRPEPARLGRTASDRHGPSRSLKRLLRAAARRAHRRRPPRPTWPRPCGSQVTEAGVLMISPTSTAGLPAVGADRGLFWRMSPDERAPGRDARHARPRRGAREGGDPLQTATSTASSSRDSVAAAVEQRGGRSSRGSRTTPPRRLRRRRRRR